MVLFYFWFLGVRVLKIKPKTKRQLLIAACVSLFSVSTIYGANCTQGDTPSTTSGGSSSSGGAAASTAAPGDNPGGAPGDLLVGGTPITSEGERYTPPDISQDSIAPEALRYLSVGNNYACAVKGAEHIQCWGLWTRDQPFGVGLPGPGDNAVLDRARYVRLNNDELVSGLVSSIDSAGPYSCAVVNNKLYCWGILPDVVKRTFFDSDFGQRDELKVTAMLQGFAVSVPLSTQIHNTIGTIHQVFTAIDSLCLAGTRGLYCMGVDLNEGLDSQGRPTLGHTLNNTYAAYSLGRPTMASASVRITDSPIRSLYRVDDINLRSFKAHQTGYCGIYRNTNTLIDNRNVYRCFGVSQRYNITNGRTRSDIALPAMVSIHSPYSMHSRNRDGLRNVSQTHSMGCAIVGKDDDELECWGMGSATYWRTSNHFDSSSTAHYIQYPAILSLPRELDDPSRTLTPELPQRSYLHFSRTAAFRELALTARAIFSIDAEGRLECLGNRTACGHGDLFSVEHGARFNEDHSFQNALTPYIEGNTYITDRRSWGRFETIRATNTLGSATPNLPAITDNLNLSSENSFACAVNETNRIACWGTAHPSLYLPIEFSLAH